MKSKKIRILVAVLAFVLIVSIGAFAVAANDNASPNDGGDVIQALKSAFKYASERAGSIFGSEKNGKFPEGSEFPEGEFPEGDAIHGRFEFGGPDGEFPEFPDGEKPHNFKMNDKNGGFGFGIGIGGVKGFFGSDGVDIADILGVTEEELRDMIKEAGGNIFKVLEDAGKLDEYKAAILQNFRAKLDEQVASGAITKEKAEEAYGMLKEAVDDFSSEGCGAGKPGFGGHIRHFRDFGDDNEEKPAREQNYKTRRTADDTEM